MNCIGFAIERYDMNWQDFTTHPIAMKWLATALWAAFVLGLRAVALRKLSGRGQFAKKERRRWAVTIRNIALFIFGVGILYIWFEQLRMITTTVMVVAVAIVLATKEYFLNLTGYLFRSSTNFFKIGDRITIGELHGDVIDQSLMGVTIMEISANHLYTGQAIFIPNIKFMKQHVKNESYTKDYVYHFITVPVKNDSNVEKSRIALLTAGQTVCASYIEEARMHMKKFEDKHNLDTPPVEPRIYIKLPKPDQVDLVLRVPIPAKRRGRLNQEIMQEYLSLMETSSIEKDLGAQNYAETN
jgi:small-conductance mechanosensitive channel